MPVCVCVYLPPAAPTSPPPPSLPSAPTRSSADLPLTSVSHLQATGQQPHQLHRRWSLPSPARFGDTVSPPPASSAGFSLLSSPLLSFPLTLSVCFLIVLEGQTVLRCGPVAHSLVRSDTVAFSMQPPVRQLKLLLCHCAASLPPEKVFWLFWVHVKTSGVPCVFCLECLWNCVSYFKPCARLTLTLKSVLRSPSSLTRAGLVGVHSKCLDSTHLMCLLSEFIFIPWVSPGSSRRGCEAGSGRGSNRRISIKPIGRALSANLILQMSAAHWGPGAKPPPPLIPGSRGHGGYIIVRQVFPAVLARWKENQRRKKIFHFLSSVLMTRAENDLIKQEPESRKVWVSRESIFINNTEPP